MRSSSWNISTILFYFAALVPFVVVGTTTIASLSSSFTEPINVLSFLSGSYWIARGAGGVAGTEAFSELYKCCWFSYRL